MIIKYEKIELPNDFPFMLSNVMHAPFESMGDKYHWHDCFELSYAKSGNGRYDFQNRQYTLDKGELMVINNVEPHHMAAGGKGLNQIIIVFDPSLVWSGSKNLLDYNYIKTFVDRGDGFNNKISKDDPYFEEVSKIINDLEEEFKNKTPGWQLMIKARLLELLTLLYRQFRPQNSGEGKRHKLIRLSPVLSKIEEEFTSDLTAKDMAHILHVTPQYFSQIFKETIGINFINYIILRRISLAKDKLKTTNIGITEIAYLCGFKNLSYFNETFRENVGMTPKEFRKSSAE